MSASESYSVQPIGFIRSELKRCADAPKQGTEGAPEAWLELLPEYAAGLERMNAGDEIIVLTWLHLAERDVLQVHPRNNPANPVTGVFSTRSPARPNPIGLHKVKVLTIEPGRLRIGPIEAIDGTPVVDIKSAFRAGDC